MPAINWPTAVGMSEAIRKLVSDPAQFIGSRFAPMVNSMFQKIEYEEMHGPQGMTNPHALDAEPQVRTFPPRVKKSFEPAYFKEFHVIKESDILMLKRFGGAEDQLAGVQELIGLALDDLNTRIENRLEWMRWQALLNGRVQINSSVTSVNIDAPYGVSAANLSKTVAIDWISGYATATPIEDILGWQQDFVGSGFALGTFLMNSYTAMKMCLTTQFMDHLSGAGITEKVLPGNLSRYGPTFIPGTEIIINDNGFTADGTELDAVGNALYTAGDFVKFIPDNKIIMLGAGAPGKIIKVVSVPSLHSPTGQPTPGKFAFVIDKTGTQEKNPRVEVVAGIYALPMMQYPEALMVADITAT